MTLSLWKNDYKIDKLMAMVKKAMNQNKNMNHLPENMDPPKYQDPTDKR